MTGQVMITQYLAFVFFLALRLLNEYVGLQKLFVTTTTHSLFEHNRHGTACTAAFIPQLCTN